jgi:hypothetical protein
MQEVSAFKSSKSLGIFAALSQKLVRLFLFAENGVVSLETAAQQLKTKMRRLYDIANILSSLQLIEKASAADRVRKPAFKWIYNESTFLKSCLVSKNVEMFSKELEGMGRKRGSGSISQEGGPSKRPIASNRSTKRKLVKAELCISEDSALDKLATVAELMFTSTQQKSPISPIPIIETAHNSDLDSAAIETYLTSKIASLQSLLSQISSRQHTDADKSGNRPIENISPPSISAQNPSSMESPLLPDICC